MANRGALVAAIVLLCMQAALWPTVAASSAGRPELSRRHLSQRTNIVTATSISYVSSYTDVNNVVATATAKAVADVQGGATPFAAANVAAVAIGDATAIAVAQSIVILDVQGNGAAFGTATGSARAVAVVVARALAQGIAVATNGDVDAIAVVQNEASESVLAEALAIVEVTASSTGGTVVAYQQVVSTSVARIVARALADALAFVVGNSAHAQGGSMAEVGVLDVSNAVDTTSSTNVTGEGNAGAAGLGISQASAVEPEFINEG